MKRTCSWRRQLEGTKPVEQKRKNQKKEQHAGKETLHFDWFAPHFRHRYVTTEIWPNFSGSHTVSLKNQPIGDKKSAHVT